jgi:hypothetical protein
MFHFSSLSSPPPLLSGGEGRREINIRMYMICVSQLANSIVAPGEKYHHTSSDTG